jgi:hypothetical protein
MSITSCNVVILKPALNTTLQMKISNYSEQFESIYSLYHLSNTKTQTEELKTIEILDCGWTKGNKIIKLFVAIIIANE